MHTYQKLESEKYLADLPAIAPPRPKGWIRRFLFQMLGLFLFALVAGLLWSYLNGQFGEIRDLNVLERLAN